MYLLIWIGAYLCIICAARRKKCFQRIVSWNDESSNIHKEFATNVEEDEEKVNADETKEGIDFRDGCLLLEVVEDGVLGKLLQHRSQPAE